MARQDRKGQCEEGGQVGKAPTALSGTTLNECGEEMHQLSVSFKPHRMIVKSQMEAKL